MASLNPSAEMVAAVRMTMALPILILAIPVGTLGDRVDRRKLLILTQMLLFCTTTCLATLTFTGYITAPLLLVFTFVIGLGMVVHVPIWQASIPELVTKPQLPRAVAQGSVSFNLARAVGPAIGGILIATLGVWIAFIVNALSFAGVIVVLLCWKRDSRESTRGLSFAHSLYQGLRFVSRDRSMRNVMLGVVLFVLPASSLWSLLPLVAKTQLGWNADGFGLLVSTIGCGAVSAAWFLPRLHVKIGIDRTIAFAMTIYALGLLVLSQSTSGTLAGLAALVLGATWMMTLTTLNTTAQITLPSRMRARGMGCYLSAMAFSMSTGSLLWGQFARITSVPSAMIAAAIVLLVTTAIGLRFRVGQLPAQTG